MISCPELIRLPPRPSREYEAALLPILAKEIKPQLGVMIRRQPFDKARSIKHSVKIAGSRVMSVERKYDGEYCQIHIDNSKGQGTIQIFSKSGKDSTEDRIGLHSAIKRGLRLKTPECKIKHRAILEGELLIYSRNERDILPFHHIRKHVRHGGRRIGTEQDSPKKVGEHLMIVFFDVLMLEDKVMLSEPHRVRRAHLKGMVTPVDGEVQVVERAMIDFGSSSARELLTQSFSHAIRMRWEGFVLKGLEDPYYSWKQGVRGVKLKKDYIAGLGDSADLCIIGGHRDPKIETELDIGRLSWTTFYVACLTNKSEVQRYCARPIFRIIDRLGSGSMSKDDILALNAEGRLVEREYTPDSEFMLIKHTRKDIPPPISIYTKPMVVEIFGAGFERPQSSDFFILRFPRRVGSKIKLHKDREVGDTVDFDELQEMAQISLKEQDDAATQEEIEWMERLLAADPKSKYIIDKSQSTSPSKTQHSATTVSLTPAGRASTQSSAGARWATQPSPVRIDTSELTPTEHSERYPDSAPQTPSRRSDSTASPTSTRTRGVSKRDFADVETSPTRPPRKIKRVAFEPINRGLNLRTMSDMTDMTKEVERRRDFSGSGDKVTKDRATGDEQGEEVVMTKDQETEKGKLVTGQRSMAPPGVKKGKTIEQGTTAPEPKDTVKKTPDILLDDSTANNPAAASLNPSTSTTTENPSANSPQASPSPRKPAVETVPYITISGPILVTASLTLPLATTTTTPTPTNNNIQTTCQTLTDQNLPYTTDSTKFAHSLFPVPPSTPPNARKIILINDKNATRAAYEVQAVVRSIRLPVASDQRPTLGKALFRDVLIFDYSVLGTEWWKMMSKRGGDEDGRGDVVDPSWKRPFIGTMEMSIAYVGGGDEVKSDYEVSGELFTDRG
ncbi:DNA ligase [subsurface metagenome]